MSLFKNPDVYKKMMADNDMGFIVISYINESGYAGCLPNGNIVDRRIYPEAIPIQANGMFGVVEPKKLP